MTRSLLTAPLAVALLTLPAISQFSDGDLLVRYLGGAEDTLYLIEPVTVSLANRTTGGG